jgi:hypothetical protein
VLTCIVKCSEGLSNRVCIIIRRYIDHMEFAVSFISFFAYSSGSILYHCIDSCMICVLLFNCENYVFLLYLYIIFLVQVFLLLCMCRSVFSVSLCCSVYCLCVNVYCTTVTGCQHICG